MLQPPSGAESTSSTARDLSCLRVLLKQPLLLLLTTTMSMKMLDVRGQRQQMLRLHAPLHRRRCCAPALLLLLIMTMMMRVMAEAATTKLSDMCHRRQLPLSSHAPAAHA